MSGQVKANRRSRTSEEISVIEWEAELPPNLALTASEIRDEIPRLATEPRREQHTEQGRGSPL